MKQEFKSTLLFLISAISTALACLSFYFFIEMITLEVVMHLFLSFGFILLAIYFFYKGRFPNKTKDVRYL